eukprot:766691-Hanusia_phi.AAC.1
MKRFKSANGRRSVEWTVKAFSPVHCRLGQAMESQGFVSHDARRDAQKNITSFCPEPRETLVLPNF